MTTQQIGDSEHYTANNDALNRPRLDKNNQIFQNVVLGGWKTVNINYETPQTIQVCFLIRRHSGHFETKLSKHKEVKKTFQSAGDRACQLNTLYSRQLYLFLISLVSLSLQPFASNYFRLLYD